LAARGELKKIRVNQPGHKKQPRSNPGREFGNAGRLFHDRIGYDGDEGDNQEKLEGLQLLQPQLGIPIAERLPERGTNMASLRQCHSVKRSKRSIMSAP
jgi:hypothetical protein